MIDIGIEAYRSHPMPARIRHIALSVKDIDGFAYYSEAGAGYGDKFDTVVRNIKWLAHLGDWAYELAMFINRYLNIVRRKLGMPYWSFSAASKAMVKEAVSFIGAFEDAVIADAKHQGAQVVVCGHIHHATIRQVGSLTYVNCGDWVESRTAIAEHLDGRLELIRWDEVASRAQYSGPPAAKLQPAA